MLEVIKSLTSEDWIKLFLIACELGCIVGYIIAWKIKIR